MTAAVALALVVAAGLPEGYLVWTRGTADDPGSRKIHRLTLPDLGDERTLTSGEDVEPQVSPDGRWVAYAKAKFPGGSDYHDFKLWRIYVVSIHGAGQGRKEIKVDDDGAWPSWSKSGALFYDQADGTHSRLVRVELDDLGRVTRRQAVVATRDAFGGFAEVNEGFVAPDESWFAARTRGNQAQNGVGAFRVDPPAHVLLARAGDIGCMPRVSPDGRFGIIAGADQGIRWGHAPQIANRKEDQLLIPPRTPAHKAYHPGFSTDGKWVLAAQSTDADHNSGHYDLFAYTLDASSMTTGPEQLLVAGEFNGWPHLWVGKPGPPPPPRPVVDDFWASSYTIAPGEKVTLAWSTFGADQVLLGDEAVDGDGTREVAPAATTSYTLRARSSQVDDSDARTVDVAVNDTPVPVTIERFAVEAAHVERGRSTRLVWQARNATTLDLDGARVAPAGMREIDPLETTTYVLTARGHMGPAVAQVTVVVEAQSSGLLPDRGGFTCAAGRRGGAGGVALAGVLAAWLATRRRARAIRTATTTRRARR